MEISALFTPIWRQKWHVILFGIVTSLLLLIYSQYFSAPNYSSNVFFTVAYRDEQRTDTDYDYANYYGNYASIEFARTLSAWPKDPYFVKQVYDDAGVDKETDQGLIDKLLGNFSVKAVERANLQGSIRSSSEVNLRKLTSSFIKIMQQRLDTYNRQSATQYQLINITSTPFITFLQADEAIPFGFILGLILGIIWSYVWEAWQGKLSTAEQLRTIFEQPLLWIKKGSSKDFSPVIAQINSWNKDIVLVNNRINSKKFFQQLSKFSHETITIISPSAEKLKKFIPSNSQLTISESAPTGKKANKALYWIDFPQDATGLIEHNSASLLILTQRGRSRIHELESLKLLTPNQTKAVILM